MPPQHTCRRSCCYCFFQYFRFKGPKLQKFKKLKPDQKEKYDF